MEFYLLGHDKREEFWVEVDSKYGILTQAQVYVPNSYIDGWVDCLKYVKDNDSFLELVEEARQKELKNREEVKLEEKGDL